MNKRQAITSIMESVNDDDIVISSVGYTSRYLYAIKDRPLNFYMMGSMGCELAFGIGVALNTKRKVHVISGDGSAMMGVNTTFLFNRLASMVSLTHYIIDDDSFQSTGGQSSVGFPLYMIDQDSIHIHINRRCKVPPRIPLTPVQIKERFYEAVHK